MLQILNGTLYWQWTGGCSFTRTSFTLWAVMMLLERYPGQVRTLTTSSVLECGLMITSLKNGQRKSVTVDPNGDAVWSGDVVRLGYLKGPFKPLIRRTSL